MKTKNEYLKQQGINLEKDFSIGTYTKIRFAMEKYAIDYHNSEVKKINIPAVSDSKRKVCPVCKKAFEKGWGEFCSQDCWDTDM